MGMIKKQFAKILNLKDRRGNYDDSRISTLEDKYKGKRCFIIGTGPSLNKTKLGLLKDEICFGVNTLYGIKPDCKYWVIADHMLWRKKQADIKNKVKSELIFFTETVPKFFKNLSGEKSIVLRPLGSMNVWYKFSTDLDKGTYSGGTVVIHALQIAFYMGFTNVYLVGCDTDYSGMHHFDGSTCGEIGDPDGKVPSGNTEYVLSAYRQCRQAFEQDNRRIINVTVGGELDVFEREKLEDIV